MRPHEEQRPQQDEVLAQHADDGKANASVWVNRSG